MSGANTDLFVAVLAQIERQPETWNQRWWRAETDCGTAYCFAGWACTLSGEKWQGHEGIVRGSGAEWIAPVAEELLGLESRYFDRDDDRDDLFHPFNTLDDLYRISAGVCGLDPQVLKDKVASEVADGRVQQ